MVLSQAAYPGLSEQKICPKEIVGKLLKILFNADTYNLFPVHHKVDSFVH